MCDPAIERPVAGDLLSCYTTSIAEYMEGNRIDHQLAMGAQLFLAVGLQEARELQFSFVHYHTPLLGETATHSLHLIRRSTAEPHEAARRIVAQCRQRGPVVVVGDAMNLPWLVTYGRKHAPHWFVVRAVDERDGKVQIADRFEFVDEGGTQLPFVGWLDLERLGGLAQVCPMRSHVFQSRDRWAFGAQEQASADDSAEYQWFEGAAPAAHALTSTGALELLARTWAFQAGRRRRPDLPAPQWTCGLDAIDFLAGCCQSHLGDPALYEISDDVWVAARNRQLFARVLQRLGAELDLEALRALAAWCEEQLIPQWYALPRIMHYNVLCLRRGRQPTALLVETMRVVARLEADLIERLAGVLSGSCGIDAPLDEDGGGP